jgi:hypothetical protein
MMTQDPFLRSILTNSFAFVGSPDPDIEFGEFFEGWSAFFRSEEKVSYLSTPGCLPGYFPFGSERAIGSRAADPKEFFHYYKNGICPPALLSATNRVFEACRCTAITVGRSFDQLNLWGGRLEETVRTSDKLLLRVLRYLPDNVAENFADSHTDIDLFTIIPAVQGEGLIVEQRGDSAQEITHSPKTFLVLAGDMLELVSGGNVHAARHRVAKMNNTRMSVTFFVNPNDDVLIDGANSAGSLLSMRLQQMKS